LANRLIKILRPPFDFFLARNPCLRFLTRCDGWYSDPYTANRFWRVEPPKVGEEEGVAARRAKMGEEEEADGGDEEEERLGRSDDNRDRDGAGRNRAVPSTFCCWAPSTGASRAARRARREDGCWATTTPRRVLDGNERGRRGMTFASAGRGFVWLV
jgi:hypothetical protein